MRRSALKPGKPLERRTPLKASAFKRSERKEVVAVKRMKVSRPKMTPIRRAARGEDCTLRIPGVCNRNPETSVLCHSNRLADGKGMGLKAPDTEACIGCSSCHDVLDGRAPRPEWMTYEALQECFDRARERTHVILRQKGLL
jgi:hypothetical protein